MKQLSNPSKKAMVKLLMLSVIVIFSCKTTHAQVSPKWTSFNIEMESKNILKLTWSVDQQKNNKEYIIQKSADLKNWKAIGRIKNMSEENTAQYSFNDKKMSEGMNYYRIAEKDMKGNISYSVLKVVDNSARNSAFDLTYDAKKAD